VVALACLAGCETVAPTTVVRQPPVILPAVEGSYHLVQPGETLWRIARSYGVDLQTLATVNRLSHPTRLAVGQRLFIPLPPQSSRFFWPLRGTLAPSSGSAGIEITAPPGTLVRAARSGRVAVATPRLSGWGATVLLDHFDGHVSVYANLERLLVAPGTTVRQGMPVGRVGGEPLHFEIRYGTTARDALALLPTTS
jgi:murein DD-endopeptidase MepM/ murein hydrolase activator NlpD